MKNYFTLPILILTLLLLNSCTSTAHYPLVSVYGADLNNENYTVNEELKVKGEKTSHVVFIFPFKTTGRLWTTIPGFNQELKRFPYIDQLTKNACRKSAGAVGLSNATCKVTSWYIPFIYGQYHQEIEGNPIYKGGL